MAIVARRDGFWSSLFRSKGGAQDHGSRSNFAQVSDGNDKVLGISCEAYTGSYSPAAPLYDLESGCPQVGSDIEKREVLSAKVSRKSPEAEVGRNVSGGQVEVTWCPKSDPGPFEHRGGGETLRLNGPLYTGSYEEGSGYSDVLMARQFGADRRLKASRLELMFFLRVVGRACFGQSIRAPQLVDAGPTFELPSVHPFSTETCESIKSDLEDINRQYAESVPTGLSNRFLTGFQMIAGGILWLLVVIGCIMSIGESIGPVGPICWIAAACIGIVLMAWQGIVYGCYSTRFIEAPYLIVHNQCVALNEQALYRQHRMVWSFLESDANNLYYAASNNHSPVRCMRRNQFIRIYIDNSTHNQPITS